MKGNLNRQYWSTINIIHFRSALPRPRLLPRPHPHQDQAPPADREQAGQGGQAAGGREYWTCPGGGQPVLPHWIRHHERYKKDR